MNCQKDLFSLQEGIHYLNCAYKAPLLKSAEKACTKALIRERNPIEIQVSDFFTQTEEIREQFAQLISAEAQSIAIMPSSSYGFSSVLQNVSGKPSGHAITNLDAFPSGYYNLEKWCRTHNQELLIASQEQQNSSSSSWNEDILEQITDKTSVVLIAAVHWMNGFKFDLEAIGKKCKEVDAVLIVDGTQSVGALPIDVNQYHIDALVCATYKWLFGPYSMAIAYIGEKFHNGVPLEESWMNRSNASDFQSLTNYVDTYGPHATRFNVGETSNFLLSPILLEGLKQINAWKPENIQAYCQQLSLPLFEYLQSIGVDTSNQGDFVHHLFSLNLPERVDLSLFKQELAERQIYLSQRGNSIRVSINTFNNEEDIAQLIRAINAVVS